jgi:hypothetical protein
MELITTRGALNWANPENVARLKATTMGEIFFIIDYQTGS